MANLITVETSQSPACDVCEGSRQMGQPHDTFWCEHCQRELCDSCYRDRHRPGIDTCDNFPLVACCACGKGVPGHETSWCSRCRQYLCRYCWMPKGHHDGTCSKPV